MHFVELVVGVPKNGYKKKYCCFQSQDFLRLLQAWSPGRFGENLLVGSREPIDKDPNFQCNVRPLHDLFYPELSNNLC
jgi:hypothetical protein